MSSSNIYKTTSNITNKSKLIEEISQLPLTGDLFNFFVSKGDQFEFHYKQNLIQEQVDEIAHHINDFVEIDVIANLADIYYTEASLGFEQKNNGRHYIIRRIKPFG